MPGLELTHVCMIVALDPGVEMYSGRHLSPSVANQRRVGLQQGVEMFGGFLNPFKNFYNFKGLYK